MKRELIHFIIAGILATLTDFIIYWSLHFYMLYSIAKTLSFLSGSVIAFLLNKFITFKQKNRSIKELLRFIVLYSSTLVVNVSVNSLSIYTLTSSLLRQLFSYQAIIVLAFLAATGTSTILNFLGQKFWVFAKNKEDIYAKNIIINDRSLF